MNITTTRIGDKATAAHQHIMRNTRGFTVLLLGGVLTGISSYCLSAKATMALGTSTIALFTGSYFFKEIKINPYTPAQDDSLLRDDPLNDVQKEKIKNFVDRFLLTKEKIEYESYGVRTRLKNVLETDAQPYPVDRFKALYKTYDNYDAKSLAEVKIAMGAEKFDILRTALKNPAAHAETLGLDLTKPAHIFAAQQFMKQVIAAIPLDRVFDNVHWRYRDKMASNKEGRSESICSVKTKLLMANDPVQKIDSGKPITPLDVILANAHFQVPKAIQTDTDQGVTTIKEYGPSREETREALKAEFCKLAVNAETAHVINALGTLMHKEKGNLFFSGVIYGVAELGNPYNASSSVLGGFNGFYAHHHSIMMPALINPYDKKVRPNRLSTFVHESLHFLFGRIVGNESSPTRSGSEEEKKLDEALALDRLHRQNIDEKKLPNKQKNVFQTLVTNLEKQASYFRGGFDPSNLKDLHTMRVEAIVRVMEQIAAGATRADVEAVAPGLCNFYYEVSKPMLEKYVEENAHLFK